MTTSENKQPITIVATVSYAMICFLPDGNSGTVISADLSQPAIYRLLRPARRSHAPGMFTVSEAEAADIRAVYEQRGELSAAVELRRRFPGIFSTAQARQGNALALSQAGSRCRHHSGTGKTHATG